MLSAEKTPTLYGTLPAFQKLISRLQKLRSEEDLEVYDIIQDGIRKLEQYQQETESVPAYTLAISKLSHLYIGVFLNFSLVLNPQWKLQWFTEQGLHFADLARLVLLEAVRGFFSLMFSLY